MQPAPTQATSVTDKRKSLRRAIDKTIGLSTGVGAPVECTLEDISASGARIKVADAATVPQEFLVVLNTGLKRWCRVKWRSDTAIGVIFIDPPASLTAKRA